MMTRSNTTRAALGAALLLTAACTVTPNCVSADGGLGAPVTLHDSCQGLGFRGPTPGAIVCPGAPGCECGGADICCMQAVDSSKGVCGSLGACRALALQCDGPEDCNPNTTRDLTNDGGLEAGADAGTVLPDGGAWKPTVCCLDEAQGSSGGGSSCRAASACQGKVLCRTDDDCSGLVAFPHCRPADYGTPGVADRGLDGLVGICQR